MLTASPRGRPSSIGRRWPWRVMPALGSSPVRWDRSACALAPYGRVRTGGRVRGLPGAGGRARGRRRRPVGRRDADGPARDGAGARGRARGAPAHRGRGERDVHEGRPHAAGLVSVTGRRTAGRARGGRDRGELRRGSGAAVAGDPGHAACRRRRPARGTPERGRAHAGRRTVRVSRHAGVPGGACTRAFLDEGVSIIGGCCGTGPAHTTAIAERSEGAWPDRGSS